MQTSPVVPPWKRKRPAGASPDGRSHSYRVADRDWRVTVVCPAACWANADLVGYAVCHRIPERSFFIAGVQLPSCARCSEERMGALTKFCDAVPLGAAARRESSRRRSFIGSFVVAWRDGVNSYLALSWTAAPLRDAQTWLRWRRGRLEGIALASVVLPIFNQTMWADATDERSLRWRELGAWCWLALPSWVSC